jgi:hypothetical protein
MGKKIYEFDEGYRYLQKIETVVPITNSEYKHFQKTNVICRKIKIPYFNDLFSLSNNLFYFQKDISYIEINSFIDLIEQYCFDLKIIDYLSNYNINIYNYKSLFPFYKKNYRQNIEDYLNEMKINKSFTNLLEEINLSEESFIKESTLLLEKPSYIAIIKNDNEIIKSAKKKRGYILGFTETYLEDKIIDGFYKLHHAVSK